MKWARIAKFEFVTTIKRTSYLVSLIGLPMLFALIFYTIISTTTSTAKRIAEKEARGAIFDEFGLLETTGDYLKVSSIEEGKKLILDDKVSRLYHIPKSHHTGALDDDDYLTSGTIFKYYKVKRAVSIQNDTALPRDLRELIEKALLKRASIADKAIEARIRDPFFVRTKAFDETGSQLTEEQLKKIQAGVATGIAFFMVIYLGTSFTSAFLLTAVAEEKHQRVYEVVLPYMSPLDTIIGKLVGLGCAGLLQTAVWTTVSYIIAKSNKDSLPIEIAIEPQVFVVAFTFFLVGYFVAGSYLLAIAAMGAEYRESTQWGHVSSIVFIIPVFFMNSLMLEPHSTLARVLSYIPFTAPVTVIFRYSIDAEGYPAGEMALSMLLMLAALAIGIFIASRILRFTMLLYGKRPSPKEVLRWIFA